MFKNITFVISAIAYIILAVPAEPIWIIVGGIFSFVIFIITRFIPNIAEWVVKHTNKYLILITVFFTLIMGLRFEKVWRYSRIISSIFGGNSSTVLYLIGIVLSIFSMFFMLSVLTILIELTLKCFNDFGLFSYSQVEKRNYSKKWYAGLFLVFVVQCLVLIYFGGQKSGFHVDEVYTYELSNYEYTNYGDVDGSYGTWISGDKLKEVAVPEGKELFNLTIPYWNSETDNHPLIYYSIIHILSSVFKLLGLEDIKWIGLIPNIIFCVLTTYILILLGNHLTNSKWMGFILASFWTFSTGAINTGLYIRMYALLTFWCVLFTYLHLLFFKREKSGTIDNKLILTLLFCTIAGTLTQYYFLIYAFFICAISFFSILSKREWKLLLSYSTMEISGVLIAELLFPRMIVRLFFGDRGKEALNNIAGADFITKLKDIANVMNQEIFSGYGLFIIGSAIGCYLIGIFVHKKSKTKISMETHFVEQISAGIILFVAVIIKLAPYMSDRYFMCSFPMIMVCCSYFLYFGISSMLIGRKFGGCLAGGITATVVLAITNKSFKVQDINYIYKDYVDRQNRITKYGNVPVVVVNKDFYDDSVLKWLFELQNFSDIYLCHHEDFSGIADANTDKKLENGFLLYGHMFNKDDNIVSDINKYYEISSFKIVTEIGDCIVYYIE